MKIIEEVFKRYKINVNKLLDYGFKKENDCYLYERNIHNDEFKLILTIRNDSIDGKLIDNEFNEEYKQIDMSVLSNGFISNLKSECKKILIDIRNNCFSKEYFIYNQTNRITKIIFERYNVIPEFLWEDDYTGVFRNKRNNKWFGIIMHINKKKLNSNIDKDIEALNVKLDDVDSYINNNGIYRAYHMNKKHWVSISLDETIPDEEILKLIEKSFLIIDSEK